MSRVAAIGEASRVGGYVLAGVEVLPAGSADEARATLAALDHEVGLLLLGESAAQALADELALRPGLVWTVVPG